MAALLVPAMVAVVLWWAGTGAILWAVRGRPDRFGEGLTLALIPVGVLVAALAVAARDLSPLGPYVGFAGALAVWGWHEAAFLTGRLSGPNRGPAPAGLTGVARFRAAAATVIWHEAALAATLAALFVLTWGAPDQTGTATFALLFGLRLSSKLNLHFGVPNPPAALLPPPLAHLASYFRRRPLAAPLALSTAAIAGLTVALGLAALRAEPGSPDATGAALLATLAALGLLEHLFLAAPSPDRALWGWALRERTPVTAPVAPSLSGGRDR